MLLSVHKAGSSSNFTWLGQPAQLAHAVTTLIPRPYTHTPDTHSCECNPTPPPHVSLGVHPYTSSQPVGACTTPLLLCINTSIDADACKLSPGAASSVCPPLPCLIEVLHHSCCCCCCCPNLHCTHHTATVAACTSKAKWFFFIAILSVAWAEGTYNYQWLAHLAAPRQLCIATCSYLCLFTGAACPAQAAA